MTKAEPLWTMDDPVVAVYQLRDCAVRLGRFDRRQIYAVCHKSGALRLLYVASDADAPFYGEVDGFPGASWVAEDAPKGTEA